MKKITQAKIYKNNIYSDNIPFGVNGSVVDLINGFNLEDTLGNIDVKAEGSIAEQLLRLKDKISDLIESYNIADSINTLRYYYLPYININSNSEIVSYEEIEVGDNN